MKYPENSVQSQKKSKMYFCYLAYKKCPIYKSDPRDLSAPLNPGFKSSYKPTSRWIPGGSASSGGRNCPKDTWKLEVWDYSTVLNNGLLVLIVPTWIMILQLLMQKIVCLLMIAQLRTSHFYCAFVRLAYPYDTFWSVPFQHQFVKTRFRRILSYRDMSLFYFFLPISLQFVKESSSKPRKSVYPSGNNFEGPFSML